MHRTCLCPGPTHRTSLPRTIKYEILNSFPEELISSRSWSNQCYEQHEGMEGHQMKWRPAAQSGDQYETSSRSRSLRESRSRLGLNTVWRLTSCFSGKRSGWLWSVSLNPSRPAGGSTSDSATAPLVQSAAVISVNELTLSGRCVQVLHSSQEEIIVAKQVSLILHFSHLDSYSECFINYWSSAY